MDVMLMLALDGMFGIRKTWDGSQGHGCILMAYIAIDSEA